MIINIVRLSVNYFILLSCLSLCYPIFAIASTGESTKLQAKLLQAYQKKGADYQPRTEHFTADGKAKYTNRLILEESPYLIQHAHNPVNWYAWGEEAFAQAKRENKPIFLSIGYSTCHWCHVMERESFDNEKIAQYLNKHFIAIKVDRERRPDVDKIYMTALMMVKGSGGWPMSSVLTPEGKPFFSGTYYPAEQFIQVLEQANKLWQKEEAQLRIIADKITLAVQNRQRSLKQAEHIGKERIQIAVITLLNRYDELQGGFSQAPKFPNETYLFLLLDSAIREQDKEVLAALTLTMNRMAQGGIYDQVGGGFHRYATDNDWLVPHFEKMLYNQAHLARAYLQLFQITHKRAHQRVVRQTLDYVLRDMRAPEQGFYSASDADSEAQEGKFFLWTSNEIKQTLNPALARLAIALFAITKAGNFSDDPHTGALPQGEGGTNILNLPGSIDDFARLNKLDTDKLYRDVDRIRDSLYQKRQQRIAPAIDKKIVTAWNAMMITTLARAGKEFYEEKYIDAAKRAGDYLWQTHHFDSAPTTQSGLWRASLNGQASVAATQADYAYLAQAYLALFDVTENKKWLSRAQQLATEMISRFWDKQEGSFFMSTAPGQHNQVPLFDRPKDIYDGAIPAANAVALEVLAQLYYRTGKEVYYAKAMALIASLSSIIKTSPAAFSYFLMAVNQLNFGEIGDIQYAAKGHVRVEKINLPIAKTAQKNGHKQHIKTELLISIDKGWHINSRYPKDEELIATAVALKQQDGQSAASGWKIVQAEYPQGEEVKLQFNEQPLSVYQDSVSIKLTLEAEQSSAFALPLRLAFQACSDKVCLAPESKTFYLFP